jgi:hypothetical protein
MCVCVCVNVAYIALNKLRKPPLQEQLYLEHHRCSHHCNLWDGHGGLHDLSQTTKGLSLSCCNISYLYSPDPISNKHKQPMNFQAQTE